MDDDEIEELIAVLRTLLDENGFGWAREQAEASVDPTRHRRWLADALLVAAENVTVDLAEVELAIQNELGTDDVHFKPDDSAEAEGDTFPADERLAGGGMIDAPRGSQRRGILLGLADMRYAFLNLRERLDGAA